MSIIVKALAFATKAHAGQKRKYTGEDYIAHPISVADTLRMYYSFATDEMYCAALLHDVVEDCDVTVEEIEQEFGETIAKYVEGLTDVSKPQDGNRKVRKALDRAHTHKSCFEAQIIKCADLIDNGQSIAQYDEKFAKVYLEEKRLLLDGMRDSVKRQGIWTVAYVFMLKAEGKTQEACEKLMEIAP